MGLLDFMGTSVDDPKTMATLQLAQGLLARRGVGGLLDGMQGYTGTLAAAKEAARRKAIEDEERAMRQQVQQLQFAQMQQQRAAQEAAALRAARDEEVLRRTFAPVTGVTANAATGIVGPRPEAAQAIGRPPQFDPRNVLAMGGSFDALGQALKINEGLNPAPKLMTVAPGASVINERTAQPMFQAPDRPAETPSAVREYEYAKTQGYPGTFQQFQLEQRRAGATNIGLPKIEVKMGEGIASQVGPMLKDSRAQAMAGLSLVDSSQRVLDAAERGNLYAGPLANAQLKVAQVADALGVSGKDTQEKIANTRNVVRGMAEQAVSARAQLGGQAQISNSEQELLTKATSGDIGELTAREIVQIAQLNDRLGRKMHSLHQQQLTTMGQRPELSGIAPFYQVPDLPTPASVRQTGPSVVRTGRDASGRRVEQLSDGTIRYVQ
jgi:hypothetical protein